jgi:hypothetical protein
MPLRLSVFVYKARGNMTRSSESYFDHSFILDYISYDYEFILIRKINLITNPIMPNLLDKQNK